MAVSRSPSDHPGGHLDLARVLAVEGREFIADAYRFALRREPDADGVEYYIRRLRGGSSKREILAQMYLSREARLKGHFHPELARLTIPYRLRKVPVFGWLVEIIFMIQRGLEGPRFARAAISNATLVGEELRASLDAMEQRLSILCAGRAGPPGTARALTRGSAEDMASFQAPPGGADNLNLEELVALSKQIQDRNQPT